MIVCSLVPADLSRDEEQPPAGIRQDAVGIALRGAPSDSGLINLKAIWCGPTNNDSKALDYTKIGRLANRTALRIVSWNLFG